MYNVSLLYNKRNDSHKIIEVEEFLSSFETVEEAKAYTRKLRYSDQDYKNWTIKIALDKKEEAE